MDLQGLKYIVVGAGFFGSVIAERIACDLKEQVLVIEKRDHLGGNCHSVADSVTGIECHAYGSHIFHTANPEVWAYINRFCGFNHYRHRVLTRYQGKVYQMPINLQTINDFYGCCLTPAEAQQLVQAEAERSGITDPTDLESKAVHQVGSPLYEAFVRGYTMKQWGTDPRELPPSIITRLPVRFTYKSDYFNDPWQGIPLQGYDDIFARMLNHPNITVMLRTDFFALRDRVPADCRVIYSGPIDRFCDYAFGMLSWRSIIFEKEICAVGDFQGTAVMNYADAAVPYTRIHEFRHYHEERDYPEDRSVIYREYSRAARRDDDPSYPVNTSQDRARYAQYRTAVEAMPNVILGGRLGSYAYLDMDQVIADALKVYRQEIKMKLGTSA
jgi:UDP-galactopyranose mutase